MILPTPSSTLRIEVYIDLEQVASLRQFFAIAELNKLCGLSPVEVWWIAINEPLENGVFTKVFDNKEMRRLSNLRERKGRDPNSWSLPHFELLKLL